jgi:hypothetical protein
LKPTRESILTRDSRAATTYVNIPSWSNLDPLPELQISDADFSLNGILKNRVVYSQPLDDPMFAAHKPWSAVDYGPEPYYVSDFVASILACKEQVQWPDTIAYL